MKLGEVSVNNDAFELDLKINEGYQSYSAELLRLALLILEQIRYCCRAVNGSLNQAVAS